jgi:hypothetical protein
LFRKEEFEDWSQKFDQYRSLGLRLSFRVHYRSGHGLNDTTIEPFRVALVETNFFDLQLEITVAKVGQFGRLFGKDKFAHGHANLIQSTSGIEWGTVGDHARTADIAKGRKGHVYRSPAVVVATAACVGQWKWCLVQEFSSIWFGPSGHFPHAPLWLIVARKSTLNVKAIGVSHHEWTSKRIGAKATKATVCDIIIQFMFRSSNVFGMER